jgi:glycogen debranching enzyme
MGKMEWLEANGKGGFACGSIDGELWRKWHGILWVARRPPRDRVLALAAVEEFLIADSTAYTLSSHWDGERWVPPYIRAAFEGYPAPTWSWTFPDGSTLRRTIVTPQGTNDLVVLRYELEGEESDDRTHFVLRPLLPDPVTDLFISTPPLREVQQWLSRFRKELDQNDSYPEILAALLEQGELQGLELKSLMELLDEDERHELSKFLKACGEQDLEDKIHPRKRLREVALEFEKDCEDVHTGTFYRGQQISLSLRRGQAIDIAFSTQRIFPSVDVGALVEGELARRRAPGFVRDFGLSASQNAMLSLAADQFFARTDSGSLTILAGYPWFTDWGRDAMIALPGLCLHTGRTAAAREIITHFLDYLHQGLIPNLFPEADEAPRYNTVDATLWLVEMVFRCWTPAEVARDEDLLDSLQDILHHYQLGTLNEIRMESDGLIAAGSPGAQLTWMDVKVNGQVPTPRHGKPVEIQGLWYNALILVAEALALAGEQAESARFRERAEQAADSFARRFVRSDHPYPADVVDRDLPGTADFSFRPNALLPFALRHNILPAECRAPLLRETARHLLTPRGLRTLAQGSPGYQPEYRGNVLVRDFAYHQGTVWLWPLVAYVRGVLDHRREVPELASDLGDVRAALVTHLFSEGCFGQANEIFDATAPHAPRGCFAQAWSTAVALEILRMVPE